MIDIHTHVLFGVDDGAEDIDASLRMLEQAIEGGTDTLICTPHILNGIEPDWADTCIRNVAELRNAVEKRGWNITLLHGAEVYLQSNIMEYSIYPFFTLDPAGKYVLMELPTIEIAQFTEQMVFNLQRKDFNPVLAHPERNATLQGDINRVEDLAARGVFMQVNAGSLLGDFGSSAERFAWQLLHAGLVHFAASDAHDFRNRTPVLADAYSLVRDKEGETVADLIFSKNQRAMLDGGDIGSPPVREEPPGLFQRIFSLFGR